MVFSSIPRYMDNKNKSTFLWEVDLQRNKYKSTPGCLSDLFCLQAVTRQHGKCGAEPFDIVDPSVPYLNFYLVLSSAWSSCLVLPDLWLVCLLSQNHCGVTGSLKSARCVRQGSGGGGDGNPRNPLKGRHVKLREIYIGVEEETLEKSSKVLWSSCTIFVVSVTAMI